MRLPKVAGSFYPANTNSLKNELAGYYKDINSKDVSSVKGAIVPHAGYMYSGQVAANSFVNLPEADTYILLGPNHTGYGLPISLSKDDWSTPLGIVPNDRILGEMLIGDLVAYNEEAHRYEHSLEVQLPFLQYQFNHDFKILPICMGIQSKNEAVNLGIQLAEAIQSSKKNAVIIASSDFSHYETANIAKANDGYLIQSIINMDVDEFYIRLNERKISACGFGPIAATITATKMMGAKESILLKYATSGDITGDDSGVVGYASLIFK